MAKNKIWHLHVESFRAKPEPFHITEARWEAAKARHRALARRLRVTLGWDGDILGEALKTAEIMINSNPPREDLRARAPNLRWLQTTGAGIEGLLPLDWLPREIVLTNNSGPHAAKAEDSSAMAILMLNAGMPAMIGSQRRRAWEPVYTTPVAGKTVLVIGFGDLGQAAGRAAKKLGARVVAVNRTGKARRPADVVVPTAGLDRVLPEADFVVVTTPLTPATRGLLDQRRLGLLKPSAGLVNIGRAAVVDNAALCRMLADGRLSGAVIDVHDPEPLPPRSPLWTTPNLVVTPHITCDDPRYVDALFDAWFANFERFLAGKPLRNVVDRELGY